MYDKMILEKHYFGSAGEGQKDVNFWNLYLLFSILSTVTEQKTCP
jgi:hypothetical protein